MKLIILVAALALTHGAKLERAYLPPSHARSSGGSGQFLQTPLSGSGVPSSNFGETIGQGAANEYAQPSNIAPSQYNNVNANFGNFNFDARPERAQAALERNAAILRSDNNNNGETYSYAYETQNGIYAEESGVATNGVEAQGGFSYTGDDGRVYSIRYSADQNGFVPQGDHLPTPPPVPIEILKALEQNARDEAAGIYDDGSYNEGKYADASNQYSNYQQTQNFNAYNGDEDTVVTNSALGRSGNFGNFGQGSSTGAYSASVNFGNFGQSSSTQAHSASGNIGASLAGPHSASRSNIAGGQRGSVTAAYLPPLRGSASTRNGVRQSFDARSGYRY